jgi:hypothetical protein
MKTTFKIGDERIGANGETLRLCLTSTGKEQWRTVGEDGQVVKRGRKEGSAVLEEMTLFNLLQHVGGRKFATAMKAAAKQANAETAFSAKVKVSSSWASDAVRTEEAATPAQDAPAKASKAPKAVVETV